MPLGIEPSHADQRAVKNGNRKRTAEAVNVPPTFCLYLKVPPTKNPAIADGAANEKRSGTNQNKASTAVIGS